MQIDAWFKKQQYDRFRKDPPRRCENPDCRRQPRFRGMPPTAHHCIYQQELRRVGGDVGDPRNRLMLCEDCHARHHSGTARIALTTLPDSVFEFAQLTLGVGPAYNYLRRRYRGSDPRLDELLNAC